MTNTLSIAVFKEGTLSVFENGIKVQLKPVQRENSEPLWIPLEEILRIHFQPGGFASGGHARIFCKRDNYELLLNFSLSQSTAAAQTIAVLEKARSALENPTLLVAKGVNGQIELYKDRVRIRRAGALAVMTQGLKGDKDIQLSAISSIQLKTPGTFTNGYIQFAFTGGKEAQAALFQATQDENSIMFNASQALPFQQMKDAIERQRAVVSQPASATSTAPSELDQLDRLAGLRDRGVVTEEEFQAKKTTTRFVNKVIQTKRRGSNEPRLSF